MIDTASLDILTHLPMGPCDRCLSNLSNPVAISHDGRYMLIPGLDSSFVIDTNLDLPIYRTTAKGWSVAASDTGYDFFLTHFDGSLTKIAVAP